ncbi:aromatic-ring hydroxylase C-terminal domain-containing protein [Streptomyces sp. NPDC002076]
MPIPRRLVHELLQRLHVPVGHTPDDPELRALAAGYAGRVDTLTASCPYRPDLAAVLVRPDGFTAWAADAGAQAPTSTAGLAEALEEWFGVPEGAVR